MCSQKSHWVNKGLHHEGIWKNHTISVQLVFSWYINIFIKRHQINMLSERLSWTLWFQAKICLLIYLTHRSLSENIIWIEFVLCAVFGYTPLFFMFIYQVRDMNRQHFLAFYCVLHVYSTYVEVLLCLAWFYPKVLDEPSLYFHMQLESKTADHLTLHHLPQNVFLAHQSIFSLPYE